MVLIIVTTYMPNKMTSLWTFADVAEHSNTSLNNVKVRFRSVAATQKLSELLYASHIADIHTTFP